MLAARFVAKHLCKISSYIVTKRTMATASKVQLLRDQQPQFYREGILQESATTATELLQENHDKHHIFFNRSGVLCQGELAFIPFH